MSPKMTKRIAAAIAIFLAIIMVITSFGWVFASSGSVYGMSEDDDAYTNEQLTFMKQLMEFIQDNYKDSVDSKTLMEGAYLGMFDSLEDPYSVYYLTEEAEESFVDTVNGEYYGVGIRLEMKDGKCVVISPLVDSSAEEQGIQSGDIIVKVGDTFVEGKTQDQIVSLIRGKQGTKVDLIVDRGGVQLPFSIERRTVIMNQSVRYAMVNDSKIGYIRLTSFDSDTGQEFKDALSMLLAEGAESFIVDVRNNPGGLIDQAVKVAEPFMKPGPIVSFVRQGKTIKSYTASGNNRVNKPVVLLINKGSASASEVLAGAWKDSKTATLVGTTTYGKGVAQRVVKLKNGYSMKLSLYYFVTPNKNVVDKVGVKPDILVNNQVPQEREAMLERQDEFVPMSESVKPVSGDTGLNVYGAQQRLEFLGYPVAINGVMDQDTVDAIKQFQAAEGLFAYGCLDYTTKTHLDQAVTTAIYNTGDASDLQLEKAIRILKKK